MAGEGGSWIVAMVVAVAFFLYFLRVVCFFFVTTFVEKVYASALMALTERPAEAGYVTNSIEGGVCMPVARD